MSKRIKIAYITVGEDLNSELLRRQVIELLGDIKAGMDDAEITLFSFQGVLSIINHHRDIRACRRRLKKLNISLKTIPILCPWPLPNLGFMKTDVGWRPNSVWNRSAAILFQVLALPLMLIIRMCAGYRIFHCRSYVAASIAMALKKLVPDTVVVFDPRSDFPEEHVTSGSWGFNSKDFLYWKRSECKFLQAADSVACIGPSYVEHYQRNAGSFKHFIAPNNVRCADFRRDAVQRRGARTELGIDDSCDVYVYLGGMSRGGWHRADFYKAFYDSLSELAAGFLFLFIVPAAAAELVRAAFGSRPNVRIISPAFDEVGKYLSAADYGLMFLHQPKIAVGTKIGEYLAASLPIVVNENCIGATELLKVYPSAGFVVGLGIGGMDASKKLGLEDLNTIRALKLNASSLSEFARSYFDNSKIASTYIEQYRQLSCL